MKKTIIFPDNSKYVGEVKNDKPHGKGTLIQKKQAYEFNVNDFFDDQGNLDHEKFHWHQNEAFFDKIFPETIKYVGEWKNGKQHGKGSYTKTSNQVEKYVGEWINGKRNGIGIFTNSALKLKYVGEWKNDKRHGIGIFTTIDGIVIKGIWKNGELIEKIKKLIINVKDKSFFASFNIDTPLYKIDEFVNKYRKNTNKRQNFYVDVKLSKDGHQVFLKKK